VTLSLPFLLGFVPFDRYYVLSSQFCRTDTKVQWTRTYGVAHPSVGMMRGVTAEASGEELTIETILAPISLAGSQLGKTRHVCAFFNSDEEEYRVLLPFIKDGFERGDKAIHVISPDQYRDHLQRLGARN